VTLRSYPWPARVATIGAITGRTAVADRSRADNRPVHAGFRAGAAGERDITSKIFVRIAAFIGAAALVIIGVRFFMWPEAAAWFFGMSAEAAPRGYHHAIGLRDIWLGLLLSVFAWRRMWLAIATWFTLAAGVCLGDAIIAWTSSGQVGSVIFHVVSGALSAVVAIAAWKVIPAGDTGGRRAPSSMTAGPGVRPDASRPRRACQP